MRYRASVAAVLFGCGLLMLAGCGGSSNSGGGGGGGATTPTVTVSPSPSSITAAQGTTVTVTVSGSSGTPTGTVTLTSGSFSSGAVALTSGSATITIPAGKLATGTDTLTASYTSSNTSTYNNTFGTALVTVTTGPSLTTPTVTVWPFPWSVTSTQSTAVTVILNGGPGNPGATGRVTLTSGSYNSGAVSLNASQAQITIPAGALATGIDTLTAIYAPDSQSSSVYNGASGTAAVNVTASFGTTTPSMTISPDPSNITLAESTTITISMGAVNGNPTPTGSVILTGPNYYSSGFVALSNGSAQITVHGSTLGSGTVPLTVTYAPDANSSSIYTSGMENFSVIVSSGSLLSPTVTVSNLPAVTTAQPLTVTVTVDGGNGNPEPTGSVVLSSGTYTSNPATLVNGSAQITIPAGTLQVATANLTASYTPDAGSSSIYTSALGTGSVYVTSSTQPAPTVSVSVNPSTIGASGTPATITVTVSGGSGNPIPTGTVTLTSGSLTPQGTALANGSGQFILSGGALAVGTDTLTATYIPDANSSSTYSSASGSASITVVSGKLTAPAVIVTPNPSSISSTGSTIVSVLVSGSSSIATGSVTLTSGTYSSGAVTLSSGTAQIVVQGSSLAAGNDSLTASYTPDANSSSTYTTAMGSGSVTVTALAITGFTASPNPIPYGSTSTQLTAVFTGGTGVITPGNLSVTSSTPVSVSPTATTTYTLTVTPTTGTAITQTFTVGLATGGVTVNPAHTGIAVTNQILGMNMGMWDDFTANTSSIVSAFQNTGVVALRWPGGSNADIYHWNSGAANPANGTAPTVSTCNSAYFNPNTNYLNFINDIENSISGGFDIALTANYGTNPACTGGGDPNEAANWVKYAYANGGKVSYVTVGNEDYGHWETDMHAVQWDPTTYANAVMGTSGYYDLIKSANPSTLVGIVVDANCTMANDCTNGWDSTVLSNATGCTGAGTPCYDFVEYHYYPQNPTHESDSFLIDQAPQIFTADINTVKSELQTVGVPNTPIYVGEIGSVSSNPGKQTWSITQGLYTGQILGEMMNDGIARMTWYIGFGNCNGTSNNNESASLYGWQNFGAYNIFSDGPNDEDYATNTFCNYGGNGNTIGTMSPTAVAFDLFSNVAVNGEHVLTPSVSGDTTDVVAYAATHSGGTAIVVFNRNETTSEPVTITVTGESTSPGVTWYSYDKEMYDYTDTACPTDPTCTWDSTHDYSTVDWVGPTSTSLGTQALPLTVTLQPWSMNVFIVQ